MMHALNMKRCVIIGALLIAATVTVYGRTVDFKFLKWDDTERLTQNPHVTRGLTMDGIAWAFTTAEHAPYWHPPTWVSHMIDYDLYGRNPAGHHATNVLLHTLNTLLLFALLVGMMGRPWPAGAAAAVFAVHPLHVESVAWVSARPDLLSTTLGLASLWAYVRYAQRGGAGRYALSAALLSVGLMAKPMLVTLPLLMLLIDYWPLERWPSTPPVRGRGAALIVEKIPFLALCLASAAVTYGVGQSPPAPAHIAGKVDLLPRLANAVVSYTRYLGNTLWPRNLSPLYTHPYLAGGAEWALWQIAGAALVLIAITVFFLVIIRRRYAQMGWLWYLLSLGPVIGVVQVGKQAMADRYMYLPLVGLSIMVVWGGAELMSKRAGRVVASMLVVGVLAGCMAASWVQTGYWRDSVSIFTRVLEVQRDDPTAHVNLGRAIQDRGETQKAIHLYERAIEIDENNAMAHNNLGVVLGSMGKFDDALRHFAEALRIWPEYVLVYVNRGDLYAARGNLLEAMSQYEEALKIEPEYVVALNNLGYMLSQLGNRGAAEQRYLEAILIQPLYAEAHNNLGGLYLQMGDVERAVHHLRKATTSRPSYGMGRLNYGVALMRVGQFGTAVVQLREAVRLMPRNPAPRVSLSWILSTSANSHLRDGAEALRLAVEAGQMSEMPDPQTLDTLAAAYAETGQFGRAVATAEQALAEAEARGAPPAVIEQIRRRIRMYKRHTPYRHPSAVSSGSAG